MKFYIWSDEHGQFWKPNQMGYTRLLAEAGVYETVEAKLILENANAHVDIPNEYMIPAEDDIPPDKVAAAFIEYLETNTPLDKLWEEYNINNIKAGDMGFSWEQFTAQLQNVLQTMIEDGVGK